MRTTTRGFLCAGLVVLVALPARAQPAPRAAEPLSERRVAYVIDAVLDPQARTVHGTQRLTWSNPDQVPVDTLQFHLYLNAFRDANSTFMRESGGRHRGFAAEGEDVWGGIEITQMQIVNDPGATDLTSRLDFIQPDDNNADDRTVAAVMLPQAVPPGETITLAIDFEARLPKIVARTGWVEKPSGELFFMVAQWFPKLGVYEVPGQRYVLSDAPRGRWSTHQFHANSEFYADFGTYEVTITVPQNYVVGATGVRTSEEEEGDPAERGQAVRTLTYRADDVHDFAWTASPAFIEHTDQWQDVRLRLLLQPEHAGQAERHFEAAKTALDYFDQWVGEYPYSTLTLVDGVGGSNGMEYPTLITCGTFYMLPSWLRALELVTIHEFGHQYFYGILASNEAEEAWLDEGINSYLETRIMDAAYGPGSALDFPGLRISDSAFQRLAYTKSKPGRSAIYTRSWEYTYSSDYGKASYSKPATVLSTLEGYVGWDVMQEILQTYYARWRFRHPTTRDFIAVAEEVSGQDLDWFFDAYVYGIDVVDYAVDGLSSREMEGEAEPVYESKVTVERLRDGVFPQTLRVRFEDDTTEDVRWDGKGREKTFTFVRLVPVREAYLDPENLVRLDVNRLNNRRVATPTGTLARKEQLKAAVWVQQLFHLVSGIL